MVHAYCLVSNIIEDTIDQSRNWYKVYDSDNY